jgi:hypothetical protein
MADKPPRHRYPFWLAWPLELVAFVIIVLTTWNYFKVALQTVFQQWPFTLENLGAFPYVKQVVVNLIGPVPLGPVPWESLYDPLWRLSVNAFLLFFLAALIRNFLPRLRLHEKGLQVRRGLGWATVPWERIVLVNTMSLPGDRMVILIQGRRLRLGPWFRFYSLLWGAGLKKGLLVTWHISEFDTLANSLVANLQQVYGEQDLALVVDDTSYSLIYAFIFLPRATWQTLFAPRQLRADAYTYPTWVRAATRGAAVLLLVLAIWRYLGVWWRYLAGHFPDMAYALYWPVIGPLLSTFGPTAAHPAEPANFLSQPEMALLLAQVSMILVLAAVVFILNLFPDWMLGAEGPSPHVRKLWMPIPWASILCIRETIFSNGRGVILLQVRRTCLTLWHTLYSLFYGAGLRRGVLFTSLLPGFEQMRERVHLGVIRAHEKDPTPPQRPILEENGETEFLLMLREPAATLRRWGQASQPELTGEGGLLKKPAGFTPWPAGDLPWETSEEEKKPEAGEKGKRANLKRATRAAVTLGVFPLILVLLEQLLFPPLSRPLAVLALPAPSPERSPFLWVAAALVMGILTVGEWPLMSFLIGTVAETYEQPGEFRQALGLYSRAQTPRIAVGLVLIILATTGVIQPLFLLWWIAGTLWGALLIWLIGHEAFEWQGPGNIFLLVGYVLYQGLVLLVYFLVR